MSIIVSKFGGSSTSTPEMFQRLRRIIMDHPDRRYIILSAPGTGAGINVKITNLLYQCYEEYTSTGEMEIPLKEIKRRFSSLSAGLGLPDISPLAESEIKKAVLISPDHTASRGEYLCALLFSRWTGIPMVDAVDIIHYKEDGSTDVVKTRVAIEKMTGRYPRAVIPGFYGAMPDGSIHTFPRNGSDISGALVAAGTKADVYENWSDVDGFMSADPSIIENPIFNAHVSYRQMANLAREGAQVLHPDCLSPVADQKIPTLLKNTLNPQGPGTLISNSYTGNVFCVTGKDDYLYCRSAEACSRNLPENTPLRCFTDSSGREYMLIRRCECAAEHKCFSPIACISAFGISEECRKQIFEKITPVHYFDAADHLKILVPCEEFKDVLRLIHKIASKSVSQEE